MVGAEAGVQDRGNLVFATSDTGTQNKIIFAAGGLASDNEQMSITPDVNVHIEIDTPSTSPTTGALTVVGGVGISGDVNIDGTITFGGAGTTVETANLSVTDPFVFVGTNNQADTVDLAFIGEYASTVSTITRTVSNKALTSNVATLTTSTTHGFEVGDIVVVGTVDATFNGTYVVKEVPTTTTFTYDKTNANVTSAAVSPAGSAEVTTKRRFAGAVRDASDGVFKVFKDATTKPTSTINFTEGGLSFADMRVAALTASSITVGDVSNTEFGYLNGVTSAIQTQIDTKAPSIAPIFTGTVVLPSTTSIGDVDGTEIGYLNGVSSNLQTQLDAKLSTATASASYTNQDITISTPTFTSNAYTLISSDASKLIMASNSSTAATITIPLNVTAAISTGKQITIVQSGSGQITIIGASGVTLNSTPGNKLRAQWSAATLIKTSENTWLLTGDLTA
jgi:signal recognition particle receptor subunit beta